MDKKNKIKLSEIEDMLKEVFKEGYGHTITLKINGEYYEIIDKQ